MRLGYGALRLWGLGYEIRAQGYGVRVIGLWDDYGIMGLWLKVTDYMGCYYGHRAGVK